MKLRRRPNRIDPFADPHGIADAALDYILQAEQTIRGEGQGHRKLDAAATALASLIDIPLLPEALEVLAARLLIQVVFGTIGNIEEAVKARKARRNA